MIKATVAETSKEVADELESSLITKLKFGLVDHLKEQIETEFREKNDAKVVKQISRSIADSIALELYQKIDDMIESGIEERVRDLIKKRGIEDEAETGNKLESLEITVPTQTAKIAGKVSFPTSQAELMAMTGKAVRKESNGVSGNDSGSEDALAELILQFLRS